MRHTSKNVVGTTRRQASRLFRLLAITMPLCLALGLSFSLPTFAQQARPTTATQAATTCIADQTWIIDIPPGGIIIWSGNSKYISNSEVEITVTLDDTTTPYTVCNFA